MTITHGANTFTRKASAIILSVALSIGWLYFAEIHVPNLDIRMQFHTQIIEGSATSPLQYRVLVPFIAEGIAQLLAPAAGYASGLMTAYLLIDLIAFALFLQLTFVFLQTWYTPEQSMIGTLFVAAMLPFSLRSHYYHPWSSVEDVMMALALILMVRKANTALAVLVAVAALNRETSVMIPIAYALTAIPWRLVIDRKNFPWRKIGWAALVGGIWLGVTAALWGLRRTSLQTQLLSFGWDFNSQAGNLAAAVINLVLFLGVLWLYAFRGLRTAPDFLRRASGIIPLYLLASALFNLWYETRPLIPTYPLFVGLALAHVFPKSKVSVPGIASDKEDTLPAP